MRGNPAAKLVVTRFNDPLHELPFPPTEQWARQMRAAFQRMADYFCTRQVRVVNMSWADDVAQIETRLTRTAGGADPRGSRARERLPGRPLRPGRRHAARALGHVNGSPNLVNLAAELFALDRR